MKQKDILLIGSVCFVSVVLAIILSHLIFAKPQDHKQTAEVVQPIVSEFPTPDSRYFNSSSFDPTQLIQIGDSSNSDPFKSAGQ